MPLSRLIIRQLLNFQLEQQYVTELAHPLQVR
jgi:hypothetical protein